MGRVLRRIVIALLIAIVIARVGTAVVRADLCKTITPDNWFLWWLWECSQETPGGGGGGAG
jgi:hypothetical protein